MQKIMAVFGDGHPDTMADLVADGEEYEVLEKWLLYIYNNPNNVENYINFYSEQI